MKIIELTAKTGIDGSLTVPAKVMREVGVTAGQSVCLAYISDAGERNIFREFLVTPKGFAEAMPPEPDIGEFEIPSDLLAAAGIPDDSDVTITCVEGAIVITQDDAQGLSELLGELYLLRGGAFGE